MKHTKLLSLIALCNVISLMSVIPTPDTSSVSPFIQFRSQGRDTARKLYGTIPYHVYLDDMESCYGTFNATFQYDRSFRQKSIAKQLFGDSLVPAPALANNTNNNSSNSNSNNEALVISSIANGNRAATDLLAENFLLPGGFVSTLTFSPRVTDYLVDFNLYVGLDRWVQGMYFRLYGPVVSNKCSLHAEERIINPGPADATSYLAGFFAPEAVPNTALFPNAGTYFAGGALTTVPGITFQPLQFSRIFVTNESIPNNNNNSSNSSGHDHRKTGFAELRGEFGWNWIRENYHVGLNIQAAAPTGTRPNAKRLFENQVGNGKHWELGGGFMAGYTFWNSEDGDRSFSFTFEADVTHLFKAEQKRTFDLKGKQLSRYMLAEQFSPAATPPNLFGDTTPTPTAANAQFNGTYAPVANFSTRDVKVSIGAQGDLVAMFTYAVRGFTWDLGYNFWGMSHEKISLNNCDSNNKPFPSNWALKGDASVYGEEIPPVGAPVIIALSATESAANIHLGTNAVLNQFTAIPTAGAPSSLQNPGIDNPETALTPNATGTGFFTLDVIGTVDPINTSIQPIFIQQSDLDVSGAQIHGYSNKIFTHLSYSWTQCERWIPYLGFGASGEFGSHRSNNNNSNSSPVTTNACSSSGNNGNKFALSKWAVEIKGGLSFH